MFMEEQNFLVRKLAELNMSQAEFGRRVDATPQNVGQWIKRGNVSKDKAFIASMVLKCSVDLICEPAQEIVEEVEQYQNMIAESSDIYEASGKKDDKFLYIPLLDVEGAAGQGKSNGGWPTVKSYNAFRKDWLNHSKARSKRLSMITVSGDSMEPTLANGDIALIDFSQDQIENGYVYAFVQDGEVRIKRLHIKGDRIIAHSDNETDPIYKYDEEIKDLESVSIIGRVINRSGDYGL